MTVITLLVVVYGLVGRGGYGRALALGGATAAGSAVVVGGTGVPTFYAVSIGVVVALGLKLLGLGRRAGLVADPMPPGGSLLILFFLWSASVTAVAPLLFDGMAIVTPGADELVAGRVTTSNVAQVLYLLLGVCTVIFLARVRAAGPGLIGLAAGTCTLLSLWRYLGQVAGVPFPEGLFDNSPSFVYIDTAAGDVPRFRGIMSEPAGLAGTSLATLGYMLPRSVQLRGWPRAGALATAGAAFYLGIVSTSTTFIVAGLAVALIAFAAGLLGFLSRRTSFSRLVSIAACGGVILALWVLPLVTTFIADAVGEKLSSSSYVDRSSSNADSLAVFLDTYGFGVGLGSARASSFVPTLLSATGLVGTLLFAAAVATLLYRGSAVPEYRPVVWALVTVMVVKIAAGPDLSDSSGILWIALGLLSRAALLGADPRHSDVLSDPASGIRKRIHPPGEHRPVVA